MYVGVLATVLVTLGTCLGTTTPSGPWTLHLSLACPGDAQTLVRAFNRTMANLTRALAAQDVTLAPLVLTFPAERFSAAILERTCAALEGKHVVAMLVVGGSPAAFGVALAAGTAGVPVLWARGDERDEGLFHQELSPMEVRLQPEARETLEAVRALLLATHWHSFTVLADHASAASSVLLRRDLAAILSASPLNPTLLMLRADAPHVVFRRLADISRSTRGVVLLLCAQDAAKRLTAEARRLNMMGGHFVWLWVDTTTSDNNRTRDGNNRSDSEPPRLLQRHNRKREAPKVSNFERIDFESAPEEDASLPVGLLAIRARPTGVDRHVVRGAVRLLVDTLRAVLAQCSDWTPLTRDVEDLASCWRNQSTSQRNFSQVFTRDLRRAVTEVMAGRRGSDVGENMDKSLLANFHILNLVPGDPPHENDAAWRVVGEVSGRAVRLDTIVWPGGDLVVAGLSSRTRSVFRIVTALAPPFVMEGELDEDGQCLRGLACHRVLTSDKDNLTLVFNEMDTQERLEEDSNEEQPDSNLPGFEPPRYRYGTSCCYGLAMDLLENVAQELEFDFHLYIVSDGVFGTRRVRTTGKTKWNGIVGDLVSGAAHMSFAALSVSSARSEVIDFSVPYFFSGVSFLAAPTQKSEIPLLAFLLPFSPELWIAIFTSLNITAMAVAVYEWLSPFGLNPWGRQRSKNFSIASALWVMWGLLCGHLVAFKAPKSWPNKFLINVWGGFSVIFVASYTANIAALIAGLFFHNSVSNYHDRGLFSQRVGAPRASAAEYYVHRANQVLWEHMQRFSVRDVEEGIRHLKNGSLDILIADTPILDYYRATDHGCKLQKIGDAMNEDTYAVGMTKGFPLKDSISAVIAKYSSNGYMDILQEKWYGALPCFKLATDMAQPRPLGVAAVAGVFILLGVGMALGILILLFEHLFYRYTLPILRHKPKGTIWRSRNIMFFSQKLYRFINCVELVSPHHAARELVHTLRQGQITSLFQKSVKRKEHEQRRRRKSKAQFFEMIQEIRRVQQEERDQPTPSGPDPGLEPCIEVSKPSPRPRKHVSSPSRSRAGFFFGSPRIKNRRFSTDALFGNNRLECPSSAIGRRLSKDSSGCWSNSPPDLNSRRGSGVVVAPNTCQQPNRLNRRQYSASHVQEDPNVGARLNSICPPVSRSATHLAAVSPVRRCNNKHSTMPKYRRRIRSETTSSLATPRPTSSFSSSPTSSLAPLAATSSIPPNSLAPPATTSSLTSPRNKRSDLNNEPRSIIEVNVTCYDAPTTIEPRRRRRHKSTPVRKFERDVPCVSSVSLSPRGSDEVFDEDVVPPPCESPLDRLDREDLVALWRSSETELRGHLLRAIRAKEVTHPP